MEPDISNNYKIDFPPRFILNILDVTMRSANQSPYGDSLSGLGHDLNSNVKERTFHENSMSNNNTNSGTSTNRSNGGGIHSNSSRSGSMFGYELQALDGGASEMQRHAHGTTYNSISAGERDDPNMVMMMMMSADREGHQPHAQLHHHHHPHMQQQQQQQQQHHLHQMKRAGDSGAGSGSNECSLVAQSEDDDPDTDLNYLQHDNFADILDYVTN